MEKFAGYGFNKSHAAAYALVAYQTAYLKAHHPAAFMAANMSAVMDDTDKVRAVPRRRARATASTVLPPDINASDYRFVPVDAKTIRYGLGGVQGHRRVGDRGDRRGARGGGPVPRPVRFLPPRRQARRQPPRGRGADPGRRLRRDRRPPREAARLGRRRAGRSRAAPRRAAAQVSLFGEEPAAPRCRSSASRDWTDAERLVNEKAALGFYLCGHPFRGYAKELAPLVRTPLASLQPRRDPVLLAGIVTGLRVRRSNHRSQPDRDGTAALSGGQ